MKAQIRRSLLLLALALPAFGAGAQSLLPQQRPIGPAPSIAVPAEDFLFQNFPLSAQDQAFLSFRRARQSNTGTAESQQALFAQLAGYPLVDYAVSWNLYDAVKSDPSDPILQAQVLDFLKSHQGEYIAERLGTDVARIAAPKGDSTFFEALYAPLQWNKTEPDLAAWHESFQLLAGKGNTEYGVSLLREAKNPHAPAFMSLAESILGRDPGKIWEISSYLIEHRFNSDAQRLLQAYMPNAPLSLPQVFSSPEKWVTTPDAQATPRLITAACLVVGYSHPEDAAAMISSLDSQIPKEDRNLLWNFLGYRSAIINTISDSSQYFTNAGEGLMDSRVSQPDEVAGWRVKAALAAGNWKEVERAIGSMTPEKLGADESAYWLGRARIAQGDRGEGEKILSSITGHHTFYGKLACDALNVPYPGDGARPSVAESDVRQWMQNPSIIRAVLLCRLGLYSMASREWNWALRDAKKPQLIAAAEYARRIGLADRMISTAGKLPDSLFQSDLSFPIPSQKSVAAIAQETNVPEAWIYGITRQESRFMVTVSSGAGARGLMQLMPATARWTAKRYGVGDGNPDLSDPLTNMKLGAYYLKYLDDRFDGQKTLATAGYNAGPGRSITWRRNLSASQDGAIFAELIPFSETRTYVKNVLNNTAEYARILGKPVRLTELLGTITPPSPDN